MPSPYERRAETSIENIGKWKDQYHRIQRWKEKFDDCRDRGRYPNFQDLTVEHLDLFVCFFVHCFSLKDWLEVSEVATSDDLDRLVAQSEHLRLCADICNRSKHQSITRPRNNPGYIDDHFYVRFENAGKLNNPYIAVYFRPQRTGAFQRIDAHDLADSCMAQWHAFLTSKGLV